MEKLKKLARLIIPRSALKPAEKAYRKGRGLFWQACYRFPARNMRVIAVTGTNGKTTTVSYINEVLKAAGYKTAALNTVFYEVNAHRTPNDTHFTVDKQSIVQSFFAKAKKADVDFVVLEVTSHALDQERIMGVPVEIAIITNLTQDHLDYHGSMEAYAAAKARVLKDFGAKYAVLNRDDKWYGYFIGEARGEVLSFGRDKSSDLVISALKIHKGGSSAEFTYLGNELKINTFIPGDFNVYNAAAAAVVGLAIGIETRKITKGIANLTGLEGRMQEIDEGQPFRVLIDFAITPDALEKSLVSLKPVTAGKIRLVFGATGDRDKGKRPDMGAAAAKFADAIYLTDDETYTENPSKIRDEVLAGIKKAKGLSKTKAIEDRKEAIKTAFSEAKKGDVVLITGLGHENSRNMGGELTPWNDAEIARNLLKR